MDEDAFLPVRRPRGIVAGDYAVLAGDVDAAEKAADRVGHRLAALFVDVEDRDLHPRGRQRLCARTAEAGGTAGDDRRNVTAQFHNPSFACQSLQNFEVAAIDDEHRSEEHTSELQSLMRISYAVF